MSESDAHGWENLSADEILERILSSIDAMPDPPEELPETLLVEIPKDPELRRATLSLIDALKSAPGGRMDPARVQPFDDAIVLVRAALGFPKVRISPKLTE